MLTSEERYVQFAFTIAHTASDGAEVMEEQPMYRDVTAIEPWDEIDLQEFNLGGIDPSRPTEAPPGSEHKVLTLAARYLAGVPLWHDEDSFEHGSVQMRPEFDGDSQSIFGDDKLDEVDELELAEV